MTICTVPVGHRTEPIAPLRSLLDLVFRDEGAAIRSDFGDKDGILIHLGSAGAANVARDRVRTELLDEEAARLRLVHIRVPVLRDEVGGRASALAVRTA